MRALRWLGAAFSIVVAALVGVVVTAAPAAAHATLEQTTPAAGAQLDTAPAAVTLLFSEPVEVATGAIRVFDAEASPVPTGRPRHSGGRRDTAEVTLPRTLPDGAYVVTWRVTSADGHPVRGAFSFRVGEVVGATDERPLVERLLAAEDGDAAVGAVFGVARAVLFAAVIVFVGSAAFVTLLWSAGWARSRRLVLWTGMLAAVATIATVGLQGAYAAGLGLGDALRWSTVSAALDTRYGTASVARLAVLAALVPLVTLRPLRSAPSKAAAGALAVALLATIGWAGHAGTGAAVPLAMALDAVHLAAVSVWLGGLVVLVLVVLGAKTAIFGDERAQNDDEGGGGQREVVTRFSKIAFWAVAVIVVTGVAQGVRQVGTEAMTTALTETDYGRLLVAKVALVAGIVALAWLSRRWVRREGSDFGSIKRTVAGEVAVAVAVVAVTAMLVNAVPARTALALPYSAELEAGALLVDLTIDPAKTGPTDVHVYTLTRAGAVAEVEDLTATLSLPAHGVAPITVPLQRAGPGHFAAYGFDVPIRGTWKLTVAVRTSDIDEDRATIDVPIR